MSLEEARSSQKNPSQDGIYIIHKHRSRTLHYDLRLEVEGALASWAVPKGAPLNPADRRLAIRVEDHPLDYAEFEGVIPEGEYGAGPVMVWDSGTYAALKDEPPADSLARGRLDVFIRGQKLRGAFALIRTSRGDARNWLLIKMKDDHTRRGGHITEEAPRSVKTGLTLDEIESQAAD